MRVEHIHVRAQFLVRLVCTFLPILLGMNVPHHLRQVNHPTQHVTQTIQILHHGQERALGLLERSRRGDWRAYPRDEKLCA